MNLGSYTTTHLIAKELLDLPIIVKTEMDKAGNIDITLHTDPQHKVILSLDYPNWVSIRDRVDSHFQDYDVTKGEK